jgi:acetylornithine deacetylase/succinyl-diaminopimelate desuccinylase-like protein
MERAEALETVRKHHNEDRAVGWAVDIARRPCPQTELYEREPLILRAIRDFYRPAYEAAGCETWIDDYGTLVATQGTGGDGPDLLLLSYAMAWTEGTMKRPWEGRVMDGSPFGVEGRVIRGRGGSEYHPTNAAQLETAHIINESGAELPGRVTYVVSSGGHTSSLDPVFHLLHNDELTADLCIMPGDKAVLLGNMGRLDLKLNVWGRSVHSGGDLSVGSNAIEGGLEALRRLKGLMPFPPGGVEDPDMGRGRLSVIGMGSYPFSPGFHDGVGSGGHTLQNLMRIVLDRRLVPGESPADAVREIRDALEGLPWRITLERSALQLPTKHDREAPIVRSVAEAYQAVVGEHPEERYAGYTIDAGYLNMRGIPTIMFGAMNMRFAHGDDDLMSVDDVLDLSKCLAYWVLRGAAG